MIAALKRRLFISSGYWDLLVTIALNLKMLRKPPVERVFHRQLQYSGLDTLYVTGIIAVLSGALVITQVTALVGGNSELTVKILIWIIVREIGPLLSALVIIARTSVSIATELALMKANHELAHLERMGIAPMDYLVVPRAAGITLAVLVLSIYFQLIAVSGGLAISALFQNTSMLEQTNRFLQIISMSDFLLVVVKGFFFGVAIAVISCYQGIHAPSTHSGVTKAAVHAVTRSLLVVFALDLVLTYLFISPM